MSMPVLVLRRLWLWGIPLHVLFFWYYENSNVQLLQQWTSVQFMFKEWNIEHLEFRQCASVDSCITIVHILSLHYLSCLAAETILLAFQNYILMLGTSVMIPSFLVPAMGGNPVSWISASLSSYICLTFCQPLSAWYVNIISTIVAFNSPLAMILIVSCLVSCSIRVTRQG